MTKRILVCGSRTWGLWDKQADPTRLNNDNMHSLISSTLQLLWRVHGEYVVVHGDAKGADRIAAASVSIWKGSVFSRYSDSMVAVEPHPADWDKHGKAAGPIRNQEMLDTGIDLCYAFVDKPLEESRGTADMVSRCAKAGVPTVIVTYQFVGRIG